MAEFEKTNASTRSCPKDWGAVVPLQTLQLCSVGRAARRGGSILVYLLERRGDFVPRSELAAHIGSKSYKCDAIKVYIAHIRDALAEAGRSRHLVETGGGGYRIREEDAPQVIAFLVSLMP